MGLGGGDSVGVAGAGFREILVDQPFSGKWMDVDMNLGKVKNKLSITNYSL